MSAPVQIAMYLPPPITAQEAAAIIGTLGGKARKDLAEQQAAMIRSEAA